MAQPQRIHSTGSRTLRGGMVLARSVHAARLELKLLLRHGLATLARLEPKVDYVARRYLVEAVPVRPVEKRQTCARCTLYVVRELFYFRFSHF